MDKSLAFFRMTKIDEEKRTVYGRAVQEVPDRSGEIFDYATSKPYFEAWSKSQSEASMGKSDGNIRAMHKDVSAGIIVPGGLIFHDDEKAIDMVAHITDDNEWKKVETGTYTGFSIGGSYIKKWEDAETKKTRYTANPSETSLVDRPCGPTSTFFEVQKADGTTEQREFAKQEDADAAARSLEIAREQLAKANGCADPVVGLDRNKAITELMAKGHTIAVSDLSDAELLKLWKPEPAKPAAEAITEPAAVTEKPATEVVKTEVPVFDRKAAVEYLLTKGQKIEDLAALDNDALGKMQDEAKADDQEVEDVQVSGSPDEILVFGKMINDARMNMGDVIKMVADRINKVAAREDANLKEGKAKYGSVDFADEKNKKYPIDTAEHIRAAWNYINKEKNAGKYSVEDAKTIKGKIVAAWKEKIDKDGPPSADSKKAETVADLRKNLYSCSTFAQLLQSLVYLAESVEYEAVAEDDGSDVPGKLNDCIGMLGQILVEMVQEEVAEIAQGDDDDCCVPIMAMSNAAKDLVKRTGELSKAGARNSKKDQGAIQAVHDHAVGLGATCKGADMGGKVAKVETIDGAVAKQLSESNDVLSKALTTALESVAKLTADVEILKAQPMPSKVRLMAVSKGMDVQEIEESEIQPVVKKSGEVDDLATAIKKVQATGGKPLIGR